MVRANLVFSLLPLASLVYGECRFENGVTSPGHIEDRQALCLPQGSGDWTFAMQTELSTLGIPAGPDGGDASSVSATTFYIYDNTCKVMAAYEPPSCGVPYVAKENFLKYVLSVNTVSMDVGDPYFSFTYGDGKFSIKNDHCVCSGMDAQGMNAAKGCRCAFPVDGVTQGKSQYSKRSAKFRNLGEE